MTLSAGFSRHLDKKPTSPANESSASAAAPAKADDVLFVHSPNEAADGYRVVRKRGEVIETGELRDLKQGQPIHGEVVQLKPRENQPRLFDVEVLVDAPQPDRHRHGPAQVATAAYRDNWEHIFGDGREPN